MEKLGIITYAYPHFKTEQLITALQTLPDKSITEMKVFALPYKERKSRTVFFSHRPNQIDAVSSDIICAAYGIEYINCLDDADIDDSCDLYLVAGAGILSEKAVANRKIVNCHPGIIPAARGLDSFKWSIYNMQPLGNTLHYINENVDAGEIISVLPTPIFITDSLETLARRHYENEIRMLSSFRYFIDNPQNDYKDIKTKQATMRMSFETELKMAEMFDMYKEKYALSYSPINPRIK